MMLFLLSLFAVPSTGVRELLIPSYPGCAVYEEALTASSLACAFLSNPSLVVKTAYPYVSATHTEWFAGARKERIDALLPYTWGTLGIGVSGFHVWDLEHRAGPDSVPELFSAYNTGLELRYGRSIGNLSLGASVNAFLEHIYNYSAGGVSGSLGGSYRLKPFTFGLSVLNIGPGVRLNTETSALPLRVQAGVSCAIQNLCDISAGSAWSPDSALGAFDFSLGAGATFFKVLRLDIGGGYGAHPHAGAGLALKVKDLEVAYSASLRPSIGFSHHIGIQLTLHPPQREDPIVTRMIQTSQAFVEIGKRDLLNKDYSHALAQFDLALVWYSDNEEAQKGYNEALEKEHQRQINLHLEAARNYREEGSYLDALREYEYVLSLSSDNAMALSGRADMMLKLNETPILTMTDIPEEAVRFFEAGVEAFRKDDFSKALNYWQEISASYPYIEEIAPYIKLASERRDNQVDSLTLLAYNARERDALRQALNYTEKILSIAPTNNVAHTMREELTSLIHRRVSDSLEKALEYFDSRRFELAAETFNSILTLEPTNTIAARYLERIQKEQKLGREQLASLNVSAASAYALGDFDTAIRIWEQILAIDSTFTNVQRNLERAKNKKALLGEP
ncbi:hypothetical protein GX441_08335 [bacterium]|nr:hypothetical protein [bacterium]